MKRMVKAAIGPDVEYNVTVGFAGFIGVEHELIIEAEPDIDKEDLLYRVQEEYGDDLLDAEVIDVDEDDYEVEVTFAGMYGASEIYSVYEDNGEDAIYSAIEEAKDDLEIIEFHEL